MPMLKWLLVNGQIIQVKNLQASLLSNANNKFKISLLVSENGNDFVEILENPISSSGIHPSWSLNAFQVKSGIDIDSFLSSSFFKLQIKNESSTVLEEVLNLDDLYAVDNATKLLIKSYPKNCVMLEVGETVLVTSRISRKLGLGFELEKFVLDNYMFRSTSIHDIVQSSNKEEVEKALSSLNRQDHKSKRNCKLSELNQLRSSLKDLERNLEREKRMEALERTECNHSSNAKNLVTIISEQQSTIEKLKESMEEKKAQLLRTKFLLEARQIKLIGELRQLFPIERLENSEYSIRGIELPSDLSNSKDDDQIASALGYVVHSLLLMSKYLEIPLRYHLLYMGSRSLIRDPIGSNANATYPLFKRSIEKERFEKAIYWLKADIEQLLAVRGFTYENNRPILWNLQVMYQGEICPKLTF